MGRYQDNGAAITPGAQPLGRARREGTTLTSPVARSPEAPWERISLCAVSQPARNESKSALGLPRHLWSILSLVDSPKKSADIKITFTLADDVYVLNNNTQAY